MWDNAPLLRGIANVLFGFSLLLMLYGLVRYVLQLPAFSVRAVELATVPQHVSTELLQRVVREQVGGNFFTIDLVQTRQTFQQLPWVRSVSVRRKFPWQLEVELEEHVALARWNKTALINSYGEVFQAETDEQLPELAGMQDSAALVAQTYAALAPVLAPMNKSIVQLSLSPRFAWQLKLDDGMELALGREGMQERLARFVRVYPFSVAVKLPNARRIDLRYRNGFAVQQQGAA